MTKTILLAALLILCPITAHAVRPDEVLQDQVLEDRARDISKELRCLVCQNESIDDSDAPLAHDLRVILRQRLVAGDSNEAATQYIVARYGNYVLLKPPFQQSTLALWLGPALLFIGGVGAASIFYRQRSVAQLPLDPDEKHKVLAMMAESEEEGDNEE